MIDQPNTDVTLLPINYYFCCRFSLCVAYTSYFHKYYALVATLSHLMKPGILCLQLCTPATVPTLSASTSRLIISSKPIHPPIGTFLLALQIRHYC